MTWVIEKLAKGKLKGINTCFKVGEVEDNHIVPVHIHLMTMEVMTGDERAKIEALKGDCSYYYAKSVTNQPAL